MLAGIDTGAQDRLKTQFKVLARGFHVDEELVALGLAGTFAAYCEHEESVKSDFLYTVDGIGSVILNEDEQRFRAMVGALKDIWSGRDPEWWTAYRKENPIDRRSREDVFCLV